MSETIKAIRAQGKDYQYDYESLANRPIAASLNGVKISSTNILGSDEAMEFDLSGYLPNDGCNYLVSVQVRGAVYSKNYVTAYGKTDLTSGYAYCFFRINYVSGTMGGGGSCQMLVGPGRKFFLLNTGDSAIKDLDVYLAHYIKVS